MKRSVVIPAVVVLGFLAGSLARRAHNDAPPATRAPAAAHPAPRPPPAGAAAVSLRSEDTPDSLLELDDLELYPRLARWLLEATGEEMSGFWAGYAKRSPGRQHVVNLLLSQWTRLHPEAAITALEGSRWESLAWRAWAVHDPAAAVAAARGATATIKALVMEGICSVDPRRGLRLMEENPEFRSQYGIRAISESLARKDPAAALDLQRRHGIAGGTRILGEWASRDPRAALEWLEKNPKRSDEDYQSRFVEVLERVHPDLLAEIAAMAPSGELKRTLENAAFRKLAGEDRQAALAMARSSETPLVAAGRFAEVGNTLAKDDPQAALEVFGELLDALPKATDRVFWIRHPGGGTGSDLGADGTRELIDQLVESDPAAALAVALERGPATLWPHRSPALFVSQGWAAKDFDGYHAWMSEAVPENVGDQGLWIVAKGLADRANFAEAMDWALRISPQDPRRTSWRPLQEVALRWEKADPEAARTWLETADLPEESRKLLEIHLAPP